MSAATKAIAANGLARRAFSLGAVKALDNALQFLLPIVLVRCLDAQTFGPPSVLYSCVSSVALRISKTTFRAVGIVSSSGTALRSPTVMSSLPSLTHSGVSSSP